MVEIEDDQNKRRREVVSLIAAGQISKAMSRVTSHGLASMEDAAVLAQVAAKYPPRGRPLPAKVPKGQPVEHLRALRDRLKALLPGSSPGCGGMRPEYLRLIGEFMEEDDMVLLEDFGLSYLQGDLPSGFTHSGSQSKLSQSSRTPVVALSVHWDSERHCSKFSTKKW